MTEHAVSSSQQQTPWEPFTEAEYQDLDRLREQLNASTWRREIGVTDGFAARLLATVDALKAENAYLARTVIDKK